MEQLADIRVAAYPPGHPDHEPSTANERATRNALNDLIEGSAVGPLHPELSAVVRHIDEAHTCGAILVTSAPPDAIWPGGPWIADVMTGQFLEIMGARLDEPTATTLEEFAHTAGMVVTILSMLTLAAGAGLALVAAARDRAVPQWLAAVVIASMLGVLGVLMFGGPIR